MFNRLNPLAKLRETTQRLANTSLEKLYLTRDLEAAKLNEAELSGLLIEARGNEQKLLVEAVGYRTALRQVVGVAIRGKSPNGTTRKILRIAENAL